MACVLFLDFYYVRTGKNRDCRNDRKDVENKEMKILVSACLLGVSCRYDGGDNEIPQLAAIGQEAELIPFCPEIYGGLPTPREPSERSGERVISKSGVDVSEQFTKGAREAARVAQLLGCKAAILKERSPSCGTHQIYDGTFSSMRIPGSGVTAERLRQEGIQLFSEAELETCLVWIREKKEETGC